MQSCFLWIEKVYADKFKSHLLIILIAIGLFLIFRSTETVEQTPDNLAVDFFFHPACPHCKEQILFNEKLIDKFPNVNFIYHDITKPNEQALFLEFGRLCFRTSCAN